jgi:hypothetical protein
MLYARFGSQSQASRLPSARPFGRDGRGRCGAAGCRGLRGLSERVARHGEAVRAAIESMNGARFVHNRLELAGWQVEIAEAQKVKGLAPLLQDRQDRCVGAGGALTP